MVTQSEVAPSFAYSSLRYLECRKPEVGCLFNRSELVDKMMDDFWLDWLPRLLAPPNIGAR